MGLEDLAPAHVVHALTARVDAFDRWVNDAVTLHRTAWATRVASDVMYAGITPRTLGLALVFGAVLVIVLRAYRAAVVAGVSLVLALVAAQALKELFQRSRPPTDAALASALGYSFPSTQAAETSAIAAGLIALLLLGPGWGTRVSGVLTRRAQWLVAVGLVAAVGLVGVCMVYLGAHWVSDVVAGWLLGTTIGAAVGVVASRVALARVDP